MLHLVLARNQHIGQANDLIHEWIEHDDLEDLEGEVGEGNVSAERAGVAAGAGNHPDECLDLWGEEKQEDEHQNRAEDIEQKMDQGSTLRVLLARNGRENCARAGTDVAAEDDEHADAKVHEALRAHDDENRDGHRRGLHNGGNDKAEEHAKHRVRERSKEVDHRRDITECTHGTRHGGDADKQKAEAHDDFAGLFHHLIWDEVHHDRAREHKDRGDRGKAEGHEQCRHGGTDIRTEDDTASIAEGHQPGIHEGDDHHGGGAGGLDHGGEEQSDQEARQPVTREGFENGAELRTSDLLDAMAHHIHSRDEQAETSQKTYKYCQHVFSLMIRGSAHMALAP